MEVPFNQIKANYEDDKLEIDQAIASVLESGTYIGGQFVHDFESEFSQYHGVSYTIGCASGTDALYLVLKALGVGPGDEVITTAFSWVSSGMAISQTGATPVFVDIDFDDLQVDLSLAETAITSNSKVFLPVYLYGDTGNRAANIAFAERYNLALVEDAAQVHGIRLGLEESALQEHVVCYSFYPTKQLGALGDAGAVSTNNKELHARVRKLANMGGESGTDHFELVGINSRMDPIQAAVLTIRLGKIDARFQMKYSLAKIYDEQLDDAFRKTVLHAKHGLYQYVIRSTKREKLVRYMEGQQIGFGVHYPFTIPGTEAFGKQRGFPVAEQAAKEVLSLPIDPLHTEDQIAYVCQVLNRSIH